MSIKRVVAVAGDEIGPTSPEGGVLLNGRPLDEPYRSPAAPTRGLTALVVPEEAATVLIAVQAVLFATGVALGVQRTPTGLVFRNLVRPRTTTSSGGSSTPGLSR